MSGYFGMPIKYDRPLTPDQIFIGAILVDILQLLRYNTHSVLEFVVSMYIYICNTKPCCNIITYYTFLGIW